MEKRKLLLAASVAALTISVPSYAQTTAPQQGASDGTQAQPCDPASPDCTQTQTAPDANKEVSSGGQTGDVSSSGDVIVTGSRIRSPNLTSPVPVTSLTLTDLPEQGQGSLGDALNNLPSLRSTFSAQNSGQFIGTAGENFLDLRGLGTSRTLVLVNGRRHITGSAGAFDVDVQTIPADLVDRIDIVTGGDSAVYGSDAIAGVVNFVLKRDFTGLKLSGQSGISTHGDRGTHFITATAGKNFADGRGNVALSVQYLTSDPIYFRDRARYRNPCGFEPAEDTTGEAQSGDGIPDNAYVCNIRVPGISVGGTVGLISLDGTQLAFNPQGDLVTATPDTSLLGVNGDVLSRDPLTGATLNETGQVVVGTKRFDANLLAHFDFSNAFKPFVEATYVRLNVLQEGQPSFFQGELSDFFGDIVPSLKCTNAFLTDQASATLQDYGVCGADGSGTIPLSRFNSDFGGRQETDRRQTFRIVGGVEGDFNDDWHYEVSVNYGHFKSNNIEHNDLKLTDINGNPAGFSLAVDAVRNSAGDIVCGVNADADPTNDAADCVPINLFGYGAPSQAALNYINTTSHLYSKASQLDILAYVSGDSSQAFSLPGGPIGFSVGGEYRKETTEQHADPLSAAGGTFFNAFPEFDPPAFKVAEVFGELSIPLLKDLPFVKELTASGAARYSDYNTSADKTFAWNASLVYAPTSDVRFRANYSKSVRVPTLGDLYTPPTVNFGQLSDPCNQANINEGSTNRPANCAALGVPTTVLAGAPCDNALFPVGSPFVNCPARNATLQYTSAGNPDLKEETGKSLTVGAVFTPRFLPGFSFSADYFQIKVTNLIAVLGAQTILEQCVDQANIDNQYCALIAPRDQYGDFQTPVLTSAGINYAKQTSRGIDFDLGYVHTLNNGWTARLRGLATYTLERNNYINPIDPTYYTRQLSNLGDPVFSASLSAGVSTPIIDLNWTLRYIGTQTIFAYEDTHSVEGRPPENPDVAATTRYPNVFYSDVKATFHVGKQYDFYVGADNLFNRKPPLGATGTGDGSAIFDNIGRFLYAGFEVNL